VSSRPDPLRKCIAAAAAALALEILAVCPSLADTESQPDSAAPEAAAAGATTPYDATSQGAGSRRGTIERRGGVREIEVTGKEATEGVLLPDALIVAGSDSVFADGRRLARGEGYSIDAESGVLTTDAAFVEATLVRVVYSYLPLSLARTHRAAVLESLAVLPPGFAEEARLLEVQGEREDTPAPGSGLSVGGAKTFGITVGSDRDASLEQSLRLNASGRITRDVSIRAYLSDQNTPLTPEGDTEDLRALDEVLIEIEGENVTATMGDYELLIDGGPLAEFRREQSGAMVRATPGAFDVTLAGARAEGRFTTLSFRGVDGKQGAYLLRDESGAAGITVVAGSERVWLNGQRMTRGRDNDYVIDYAGGAIEFTERRPIDDESEITADYEYAPDDYRRDTYAGRAVLGDGNRNIGISFFRESDDAESPSAVGFTDEELATLAAAGDDPELAFDDGVDSVGVGNGDYVYLDEGVFEYAGPDSGDYDLSFERQEGGDYVYDFIDGYYTYVGSGEGEYVLGRLLPVPTDHGLIVADGRFDLGGQGFVAASAALSNHDRNTLSDLDDEDNAGNAQVLSASLPDVAGDALGGVEIGMRLDARRVAGGFRGVGRFREVGYAEKWELGGLSLPSGEAMVQGTTTVGLPSGASAELSHALLERGDALSSTKTEMRFSARPRAGGRLWANGKLVDLDVAEGTSSGRERRTLRGGIEQDVGPLRPGASYAYDERTAGPEGQRYNEYGAAVSNARPGVVTFGAEYSYRLTDRLGEDGWTKASTTQTHRYRLGLTGWPKLGIEGNVLRRVVDFREGFGEAGSRYDLVGIVLNHTSLAGGLTGDLHYTVTSTEVEEKQRFVTEEDDAEIVRVVSTGNYVPVTELTASTGWKLNPRGRRNLGAGLPQPTALGRFLTSLTLSSDLKLREMSRTDEKRGLYLFDPDVIQGPETVRGDVSGRHVARYLSSDGSVSVRFSLDTRDALDRTYTNDSTRRRDRTGALDVKLSRQGGATYRAQLDLGTRELASGAGDSYEIAERRIIGEVTTRRFKDLELKLTGSVGGEDEELSGVRVTVVTVTPALTYRIAGRGAFTVLISRIDVDASGGTLTRQPYLAGGRREGVTGEWRLNGDYRFNKLLTGSLSYTGDAPPASDVRHTLDVRVNAYF
jgi:hypothetical protein